MVSHTTIRTTMFFIVTFILFTGIANQAFPQGSLVIVGGGLDDTNQEIFNPLIRFAGGKEKATFAVIPSSSGVPVQSYTSFRNTLISYGIHPDHIYLIPIAMMDDDSTADVNESTWHLNGDDPRLADIVRSCLAVWFTGGDQSRTIKTLLRPDGSRTLVLEAVWEVYQSGGVVGGSSAGAAIMSEAMIGGGNSLGALTHGVVTDFQGEDFPEGEGVLMMRGLGFFPHGIIDQHFDARGRIGRLAVALLDETFGADAGFGIDENTALIYMGAQNLITVAGASGVTIIQTSDSHVSYVQDRIQIGNLRVSYLQQGDTYDCNTGEITPAAPRKSMRGKEYYDIRNPGQAGILTGNSTTFRDLVTTNLMDNRGADTVRNISLSDSTSGFLVTLSKTPASGGFYAEEPYGTETYTVIHVRMDITPVRISITPW